MFHRKRYHRPRRPWLALLALLGSSFLLLIWLSGEIHTALSLQLRAKENRSSAIRRQGQSLTLAAPVNTVLGQADSASVVLDECTHLHLERFYDSIHKADMEDRSYQHSTQAPAFLPVSQSLRPSSLSPSSYPSDSKPDATTFKPHPADSTLYADSITSEDAKYLRKQAAELAAPTTSPKPVAVKLRRELHPQSAPVDLVPDENPLSPTSFSGPNHHQSSRAASDAALHNHLPGQAVHANQHIKGGTWKYGLCDFRDIGVCCTGVWCPCIIYGKTQYRLSQRSERKDPTNMLGYSTLNGSCAAFALLCGCNVILAAIQHSRLRKAYDIPGGVGTDFVRACCCCCCTLSQDEKEIKFRETEARKPPASTGPMQYMSPAGMDFSAPPK